jgi:hypothetical protein
MSVSYFKNVAKKFNLKVDYIGYYGGLFRFWRGKENATMMQRMACSILILFGEIAGRISLNNKYLSPFLVMIAEKK